MLTERCFIKENAGCSACTSFAFTDRRGMQFPVMREYEHRNLIFNSLPTYMGDKAGELARYRIRHSHFVFSNESAREIREILGAYRRGESLGTQVRRIGVSEAHVYTEAEKTSAARTDVPKDMPKKDRSGAAKGVSDKKRAQGAPPRQKAPHAQSTRFAKNKKTDGKKHR